jgi:hypothetical protein
VRKVKAGFLALVLMFTTASAAFAGGGGPRIYVQEKELQFDAAPYIENDRTMVPLRALSEALGFQVKYDAADKRITLVKDRDEIVLWIGSTKVLVNGKEQVAEVAPVVRDDRTFVPLRFIAENLGAQVVWNQGDQSIRVKPGAQAARELLDKSNALYRGEQAPDMKVTGQMKIHLQMEGSGLSFKMEMPSDFKVHVYQKNVLTEMIASFQGQTIKAVSVIKDGNMYMSDPTTGEWRFVQKVDLKTGLPSLPGGSTELLDLASLDATILNNAKLKLGPSEVVNGVKATRVDIDLSGVDLGQLLEKVAAPLQTELPSTDTFKFERFLISQWMDPETGRVQKVTMDMAMSSAITEQGQTVNMLVTMSGDMQYQYVSEPIQFPELPPAEQPMMDQ